MNSVGEKWFKPVRTEDYDVKADWRGTDCLLTLCNLTDHTIRPGKAAVLEMNMIFSPDTPVYGEGYNKLCQYGGTVKSIEMTGSYGDHAHYRLPVPENFQQVYNIIRFSEGNGEEALLGFSSCRRFSGEFWFNEEKLLVVLNLENMEIPEGETLELEAFYAVEGSIEDTEAGFAAAIQNHHPMLQAESIPTGWCSWLVYGPDITAGNIYDNLHAIREKGLNLKYIQIDDGYQLYMGDWLKEAETFEGGMEKLCLSIREQGFEPALWVAPFIAEEKSELFQAHPDWFVKDQNGKPLPSDRVSFGGWRCGPWYMLDGTNPEACRHLTKVFRIMREQWQVKYFKLDANMWGALPFGERFKKNRTSVEAYRAGMRAILEGAGKGSFLLGCNAPMWPSLGLVHGIRVTNDNARDFDKFKQIARECFARSWQNNRLWINDPDTVLLRNSSRVVPGPEGKPVTVSTGLTREEFLYNATYALASGGMILSGDNMTEFTEEDIAVLNKLLPPSGVAAVFEDGDFSVGRIKTENRELVCIFNGDGSDREYQIKIQPGTELLDFWTEENLGVWEREFYPVHLQGHSAKTLVAYVPRQ